MSSTAATTTTATATTAAATAAATDKQFKNVFDELLWIDHTPENYHEANVLHAIWKHPLFYNPHNSFVQQDRYISHELAVFMGITHNPPYTNRVNCTQAVNEYIKTHNLQCPENSRKIIPDMTLSMLLGPLHKDDMKTGFTYFNLQKYISKHYLPGRVEHIMPEYRPDVTLTDFIKTTALPYLNAEGQIETDEDYMWDIMDFKNKTPIEDELMTIDAVAPTVILDYIRGKGLPKVVVTIAYDKPLFDMLGKTEADVVTYDDLAEILRAKMYPTLATAAVTDTDTAAAESTK